MSLPPSDADADPCVLAFPQPLERWELPYLLAGRLIQFIGERWQDADAWACPDRAHLIPDPRCPGQSVWLKLTDAATGASAWPMAVPEPVPVPVPKAVSVSRQRCGPARPPGYGGSA